MTSLNQGFVRSFNLDETIDAFKAINNLGRGSISNDLVLFASNDSNVTRLVFNRFDPVNVVTNPSGGTLFTQTDKIATYGNGDPINIKTVVKIADAIHNKLTDTLFLTLEEAHNINFNTSASVIVTMQDTYFDGPATTLLNNKPYVAISGGGNNQLILLDVGFKDETLDQSGLGTGEWSPNFNNINRYSYITSPAIPLPIINGQQLAYDTVYYIVFSNAINSFRIGRNFSRIQLIDQITFPSLNRNLVFERINKTTQENLFNLARPVFEDDDFTYRTGVLDNSFGANFSLLESLLDGANFFRFKKYLSSKQNTFQELELSLEGNLFATDVDEFNKTQSDLVNAKSPGIFILDKDLSTTENIIRTRAYSDNTQPWEFVNGTTLEYEVLRNRITGARQDPSTQEMQIGNLILADKSSSGTIEIDGMQNVVVLNPTQILTLGVPFSDPSRVRFTHKMTVLINQEVYSLCLSTRND